MYFSFKHVYEWLEPSTAAPKGLVDLQSNFTVVQKKYIGGALQQLG
jgi:hypothetical protein